MLKLMYITNRPAVALIAESAGVDRIFIDLEKLGKQERQGNMDTVQSRHGDTDIVNIRKVITQSQLLVRCNPIHDACEGYCSSDEEIENIIQCGADMIMLPYFKTVEEVDRFLALVNGRVKTNLLVETPEAVENIDKILALPGIDEVHIGINDLSLGYHKRFMFELLADGMVEKLCVKFRDAGLPYGFGGIASLGRGQLPADYVIMEHYRLGSTAAILSRSFCNANVIENTIIINRTFKNGVRDIRAFERECMQMDHMTLLEHKHELDMIVKRIAEKG